MPFRRVVRSRQARARQPQGLFSRCAIATIVLRGL